MILTCYKVWMIYSFNNFNKIRLWIMADCSYSPRFVFADIFRVTFISVAMAFNNFSCRVQFSRQTILYKITFVVAESHGTTSVFLTLLVFHCGNYWIRCSRLNFGSLGLT